MNLREADRRREEGRHHAEEHRHEEERRRAEEHHRSQERSDEERRRRERDEGQRRREAEHRHSTPPDAPISTRPVSGPRLIYWREREAGAPAAVAKRVWTLGVGASLLKLVAVALCSSACGTVWWVVVDTNPYLCDYYSESTDAATLVLLSRSVRCVSQYNSDVDSDRTACWAAWPCGDEVTTVYAQDLPVGDLPAPLARGTAGAAACTCRLT